MAAILLRPYYDEVIDGLVQNCSNSIANALELMQSSTKPSILLSHPSILGVTLCFCTGSYAAAAGRRFLFTR